MQREIDNRQSDVYVMYNMKQEVEGSMKENNIGH